MLRVMLPNYRFPNEQEPNLYINNATRSLLPNHMLYAATAPEEFRAEALADIWMSKGASRDQQMTAQAYWEARSRTEVPALYTMLKKGFQTPYKLAAWAKEALFLYHVGDHREASTL